MSTLPPTDENSPDPLYQDRWTASADDALHEGSGEPFLPPVQPPSAGFIAQLFVVPAVIVMVIIGVYLLFGRLASGEADWRQLVTDIRSDNKHVRWRSALTLAQVLEDDALRKDKGQHLASSLEVSDALTEVLTDLLKKPNPGKEETSQTDFMIIAVGHLDVPEKAIPVLLSAAEGTRERETRKLALNSIAQVCGRAFARRQPVDRPELTDRIIEISMESETLSRQQGAFILGMLTSPQATERLAAMLDDTDLKTQMNAAVGFARQNSIQGVPVFERLFEQAAEWTLDPTTIKSGEQRAEYLERGMLVINGMLAIQNLSPQLDRATRSRLLAQMSKCGDRAQDIAVQKQWVSTKAALSQ